ncbi:MAG: lipid II:glycine glycyltransferase FemX [Anaerolineae bacterium]
MIQTTSITNREHWNQIVASLPCSHILQSWEWGAFKGRHGWDPTRLAFEQGGQVRAAASVLRRRAWPLSVMYVPKGPLLDYDDGPLLEAVLAALESLARRQRVIFIKIDPDVPLEAEGVQDTLQARGWQTSAEQIQFKNTLLLDLRQGEEELLAAMKAKTRYNVRLAGRKGVVVTPGGLGDLALFYRLYAETSARDGFIIRPYAYYQDAWGSFMEAGLAQLFLARYGGDVLAGLILFTFGDRAWYMYGASRDLYRNLMPNYLLQWEAIRWARARGCAIYDMWGAPDVLDERDPMWGVYRFKAGFGGQLVRHIGAYDYPVSRPFYWLYTVAMPRYLAFLRRRHRGQFLPPFVADERGFCLAAKKCPVARVSAELSWDAKGGRGFPRPLRL